VFCRAALAVLFAALIGGLANIEQPKLSMLANRSDAEIFCRHSKFIPRGQIKHIPSVPSGPASGVISYADQVSKQNRLFPSKSLKIVRINSDEGTISSPAVLNVTWKQGIRQYVLASLFDWLAKTRLFWLSRPNSRAQSRTINNLIGPFDIQRRLIAVFRITNFTSM